MLGRFACYNFFMFKDRREAGQKLVQKLQKYKEKAGVVVLGLPRGGVVVAFEVAKVLNLPLDVLVPRKIGAPGNPELAIGAISEEGERVFDEQSMQGLRVGEDYLEKEIAKEKQEAARRLRTYRGDRSPLHLQNKTALIVDDGIATGATVRAAIKSAKAKGAKKVIVAVPVTPHSILETIGKEVDEFIYIDAPVFYMGVGQFYQVFPQTTDEEVINLLNG